MASRRRPRPAPSSADHRVLFEQGTKRRRAAGDDDPPWSSMHEDLVQQIAERVLAGGDLLDYVRFRAACRHWRSSTADPRGRGVADPRFHPRRWTMLPEGHGLHPGHPRLRGRARFFNRDTGALVCVPLPELKDHCILDSPDGLLLLQRDSDTAVRLLHPFTGDVVDLPPLRSLLPQLYQLTPKQPWLDGEQNNLPYLRRVAAAVTVAPATGTVTVLLALEHLCRFAHASTADRSWTLTSWSVKVNLSRAALPFRGSFYMANYDGSISRLDAPRHLDDGGSPAVSSSLLPPQTIAKFPGKLMLLPRLVECDSEILLVGNGTGASHSHLVVIRLADLLEGRPATPLTSIGDHCLFFGTRSFAVSSKGLPSVTGNSIVLCSTPKNGPMQYHLGDGTMSPPCDGDIVHSPPPSPHSIIHHLVTCCYRYFWNKGLMYCVATNPSWKTKRKLRFGV